MNLRWKEEKARVAGIQPGENVWEGAREVDGTIGGTFKTVYGRMSPKNLCTLSRGERGAWDVVPARDYISQPP